MSDEDDDFPVADDRLSEGVIVRQRKLRSEIPSDHRKSNDSRLVWLWNQRLAVVQNIKMKSPDIQDQMAATLVLQATMGKYLPAIELILQRLEGGAVSDQTIVEQESLPI